MRCAAPLYLLLLLATALALPACDSNEEDRESFRGTVCAEGEADCIERAGTSSRVTVAYVGRLEDGRVFDQSDGATFNLGGTIEGFRYGVAGMTVGQTRTITVPPEEGYGANPPRDSIIPRNATLIFEVTLIDVLSP